MKLSFSIEQMMKFLVQMDISRYPESFSSVADDLPRMDNRIIDSFNLLPGL